MTRRTRILDPDDPAYAGQRHYTRGFLRMYDPLVLGLFSRIWRCPPRRVIDLYDRNTGRRHLDVGPGTGHFLARTRTPPERLTLLDPNPNVLAHAARRLDHLAPDVVEADVCKPLPDLGSFDSVALNYVIHCLPGPMPSRAPVVARLAAVLRPHGVLFGATVLGDPHRHTRLSRIALRANNRRGIFDNLTDTGEALGRILEESFAEVTIDTVGSVVVFTARGPSPTRDGHSGPV